MDEFKKLLNRLGMNWISILALVSLILLDAFFIGIYKPGLFHLILLLLVNLIICLVILRLQSWLNPATKKGKIGVWVADFEGENGKQAALDLVNQLNRLWAKENLSQQFEARRLEILIRMDSPELMEKQVRKAAKAKNAALAIAGKTSGGYCHWWIFPLNGDFLLTSDFRSGEGQLSDLNIEANFRQSNLAKVYDLITAMALYKNKKYKQAEERFMILYVMKEPPINKAALAFYMGNCAVSQRNLQKAEKYYQNSLEINPISAEVWNNLGAIQGILGKKEEEIKSIKKALEIDLKCAEAWHNLGVAQAESDELEEAIESYQKSLKIDLNPGSLSNLGVVQGKLNERKKEIKSYRKALKLNPKFAGAWNNLGTAQYELGKWKNAIKNYHRALKINPEYPDALMNLGIALVKLGEMNEAIKNIGKAIKINPKYIEARYNLGLTKYKLGDISGARESWLKAQELAKEQNKQNWLAIITDILNRLDNPPEEEGTTQDK